MPRPVCTQKGRSPQKVKVTHGTAHSTEALRKTKLAFRAFRFFSSLHCLSTLYDLSTGFTSHHWWMMRGVRKRASQKSRPPHSYPLLLTERKRHLLSTSRFWCHENPSAVSPWSAPSQPHQLSAIPKFATFLDNVSPFLHQQGGQIVGLIVFPVWLAQGHSSSWLLESSAVKAEIQYGSYLTEEEQHSNVIFERTSHKEHFLCFFSHLRFRLGSKEKGQYEVGKVKSQRKTLPLCCKTWHQVGSFNWIRNQSTSSFSTTLSIFWEKKTSCPLIVTLNRRLSSEDWGSRLADSRPLLSSHHRPTSKKRS